MNEQPFPPLPTNARWTPNKVTVKWMARHITAHQAAAFLTMDVPLGTQLQMHGLSRMERDGDSKLYAKLSPAQNFHA